MVSPNPKPHVIMDEESNKFDLDQPTVPDADVVEDGEVEEGNAGTSEPETHESETVVEEEPSRIPYSRFETMHERATRAEAELDFLRSQREVSAPEPVQFNGDLPEKWTKLYGDNEASREAYGLYKAGIKEEFTTMRDELINEVRQQEYSREQEAEQTADDWATTMSDFAAKNSRKFSDAEESAILDVMDELTPKDDRGMYVVTPISYLAQAVELHDLRNQKATFAKRDARKRTVAITGARSEGEPGDSQSDGHFRPGQWDSWRNSPQLRS